MSFAGKFTFSDLQEGGTCDQQYQITSVVYESFVSTFKDTSQIHIDDDFARKNGFKSKVMHGAILNSFLSEFIGMRFPGQRALLLGCDLRYLKPCYLDDHLLLTAKVSQKLETRRAIVLDLSFYNETQQYVAARGRAQVGVFLE